MPEPSGLLNMMSLRESHALYRNSRQTDEKNWQFHLVGDEVRYVFGDATGSYDPDKPESYHVLAEQETGRKEIYQTTFSQNYSVSVNGGTGKTTYYVSANFKDIEGTVKQTGLKQGDLRTPTECRLCPRLFLYVCPWLVLSVRTI